MPHYNSTPTFDGFISLSQICISPAILSEHDFAGQEYVDFDPASPMSPGLSVGSFNFRQGTMTCGSEQESHHSLPWNLERSASTPMTTQYKSSSPSNSSSPAETVQEHQHQKRRAQNRAAQRAYRDRKVRHLLDVEQGIREVETKMMRLQNENTELIRQLCETRAANNDLRRSNTTPKAGGSSGKPKNRCVPSRSRSDGDCHMSGVNDTAAEEVETLYEPFAAMWNLIQMDPSVLQGKATAGRILENLRSLAETGSARVDNRRSQSHTAADDEGT